MGAKSPDFAFYTAFTLHGGDVWNVAFYTGKVSSDAAKRSRETSPPSFVLVRFALYGGELS